MVCSGHLVSCCGWCSYLKTSSPGRTSRYPMWMILPLSSMFLTRKTLLFAPPGTWPDEKTGYCWLDMTDAISLGFSVWLWLIACAQSALVEFLSCFYMRGPPAEFNFTTSAQKYFRMCGCGGGWVHVCTFRPSRLLHCWKLSRILRLYRLRLLLLPPLPLRSFSLFHLLRSVPLPPLPLPPPPLPPPPQRRQVQVEWVVQSRDIINRVFLPRPTPSLSLSPGHISRLVSFLCVSPIASSSWQTLSSFSAYWVSPFK